MAIKTIRFNKKEEGMVRKILYFYKADFSACVKELFAEKLEDLQDLKIIQSIKEGKAEDYFTAKEIDKLYSKNK